MSARGKKPTFATFVAGPRKSACFDRYKPATRKSVRGSLRTQLLPAFGDLPLDRIDRIRVHRWFDEYSRTAPGGANHALHTFRRIMNHAIALGHVETNPTRDVKPNPRAALTRFLSLKEIACLHRVLDDYATSRASRRRQTDIIRLLLLTGCRKGENRDPALARGRGRYSQFGGQQDRAAQGLPEYAGPGRYRAPATDGQPRRVPVAAKPGVRVFTQGPRGSRCSPAARSRTAPSGWSMRRRARPPCRRRSSASRDHARAGRRR